MEATKETVGWPANLKIRAFHCLLGELTTVSRLFLTMRSKQNWSPWYGYSRKKDKALKGSCSAEIHLGVSLSLQNRAVFFVSADPELALTNF